MPEEVTTAVEQRRFQDHVIRDYSDNPNVPDSDNIPDKVFNPNATIVRMINERRFPFGENTFFGYNPAQLGADEFNRCVRLYLERGENYGTAEDTMMLMQEIMGMEQPHRQALQELAIRVVREMYNVPDSLDMSAMITIPNAEEDLEASEPSEEEKDMLSDERKLELQEHIEKRRILNTISHGAAVHQWTSAYFLAVDRLEELNPELCAKYNKLSALVNYWNWQFYMGEAIPPVLQGMNKCNIAGKKVEAKALNFPVLIHELSKGVLDYIMSAGIPQLPAHELKYVYSVADKYSHEQWHYYFGPTLWRAMLDTASLESQQLPRVISAMSVMDYSDLSNFCIDITFHAEEVGKEHMETLKRECMKND